MPGYTGMDVPAVRNLAQQLTAKAGDIRTLMNQLTSQLGSTDWVGSDATQFRNDWQGQCSQQLNSVIQTLEHASQLATKNANEQEAASNS